MKVEKKAVDDKNNLPGVKHKDGCILLWGYDASSGTGIIAQVERRKDTIKHQQTLEGNNILSIKQKKVEA